jgi:hypothetical protein
MLGVAIVLPVVVLVVVPGFLFIFGLARVAGKRAPRPGVAEPSRRPAPRRRIAGQTQAARYCEMMRRRLARPDYS